MAGQDIPAVFISDSKAEGISIVLPGFSLIAEISNSVELCLALSVQHLKPGRQIALREGDSSPPKPRAVRFNAPQASARQLDRAVRKVDAQHGSSSS
jgi:hypothetical protein